MSLRTAAAAALITLVTACAAPPPGDDTTDDAQPPADRAHGRSSGERGAAAAAVWNPAPGDGVLRAAAALPAGSQPPPVASAIGIDPASPLQTLVLYDIGGPYGALGELYAIGAGNLASHFGGWIAKPATSYDCGELETYDATIYLGSTYDEPLPSCLLDDVLATSRPIIWSFYNIWQLQARAGYNAFIAQYGWHWIALEFDPIDAVFYKGRTLARFGGNASGVLGTAIDAPATATVLATARRQNGLTVPWAIRADNLTYVADLPFTYMTEEDRYLAFADLLFDALAPATPERHRMLLRLEDISPENDPDELRAVADYLYGEGIPFGLAVVAQYEDPRGYYNGGVAESIRMENAPEVAAALKYMIARGGVMVMHGYTHQSGRRLNPYTAVTGDDSEFYRVIENADHTLNYSGPLPNDTVTKASGRMTTARRLLRRAGLPAPAIFEFPHYAGTVAGYQAAAAAFQTRWERTLYFPGVLGNQAPNYGIIFGQLFPYPVRDVYGTRVLPENLGNIEPDWFYIFPPRFPEDIINAAEKNLVVRDGVAGFYFHPFFDLDYLRETVDGIRALGYTFVSPADL